jgi:hypothetical protein
MRLALLPQLPIHLQGEYMTLPPSLETQTITALW